MNDPGGALGIATIGVVVFLCPALALFFGGLPSRTDGFWLSGAGTGAVLLATGEWMALGQPLAIALFQGSLGAAAVLTIASVGFRAGRHRSMVALLGAWLVVVVVPLGFSLFDIEKGPLVANLGTLDFAGACALGVIPGTAALAVAIIHRWFGVVVPGPPRRPVWLLLCCGFAGVLGFVAVGVGAELVIDETTVRVLANAVIAAAGGAVGWVAAQVANIHRANAAGVVAGVFAGSVVVLPASPWLQPVAVLVLAVIASVLGHITTIALRSRSYKEAWSSLVGILLVPASVGMIGAGIVAAGPGLLYSGHTDLAQSQLQGLALVLVASFVSMLGIAAVTYGVGRAARVRASRQ